jgi:hypothetical protein
LKRKTPAGVWALRAVTATIALVVILVLGSVAYSAYEDYTAVRSELVGGSQQAVGRAVLQGSSETISINITVPNRGLYTLNVTVSCSYPTSNVVCLPSQVNVPAGQQDVLHFRMIVADVSQFENSDRIINGTVDIAMGPFVSLSIGTNFGGSVSTGGG